MRLSLTSFGFLQEVVRSSRVICVHAWLAYPISSILINIDNMNDGAIRDRLERMIDASD